MVASRLPIIDVSSPDATAVGRQIDDACRDLGFFLISGHGVSEEAIDRTYAAGLAFFDLPLGEKAAVARPAPDVSRGYNRIGDQSHAATFGEAPTVDLQESFGLGPSEARPQPKTPEEAAAFAPNLWPRRPNDLRPALEAYYRAMERLAQGAIGDPLQEDVKEDLAPVRAGEGRHCRAARIAQVGRPATPIAMRRVQCQSLGLQRLETGMCREQRAAIGFELRKIRVQVGRHVVVCNELRK